MHGLWLLQADWLHQTLDISLCGWWLLPHLSMAVLSSSHWLALSPLKLPCVMFWLYSLPVATQQLALVKVLDDTLPQAPGIPMSWDSLKDFGFCLSHLLQVHHRLSFSCKGQDKGLQRPV